MYNVENFTDLSMYGIFPTCRCWYCGKPLLRKGDDDKLPTKTVIDQWDGQERIVFAISFKGWCWQINEHIIPKSRGGTNHPDNIVDSCNLCNCSKNNKNREEYRAYLERKTGIQAYVFFAESLKNEIATKTVND